MECQLAVKSYIPAEEARSETLYKSSCLALWRALIQTDYINHDQNDLSSELTNATLCQVTKHQMLKCNCCVVTCLKACSTSALWLKCLKMSCSEPDTSGG